MEREELEKLKAFINDYSELCKKYGLALQSDDHYCGLEIVDLDKDMLEYLRMWVYRLAEDNLED